MNRIDRTRRAAFAAFFSFITIALLSYLTKETGTGLYLTASFGASMVLIYGYPNTPFAHPKNVFFGHIITTLSGLILLHFLPVTSFMLIPAAVALGIFLMIKFDVVHPPAGGNPIIVIIGEESFNFLIHPVLFGVVIILTFSAIVRYFFIKE